MFVLESVKPNSEIFKFISLCYIEIKIKASQVRKDILNAFAVDHTLACCNRQPTRVPYGSKQTS